MNNKIFKLIKENQFQLEETEDQQYFCIFDGTPLVLIKKSPAADKYKCPKCNHTLDVNRLGGGSYSIN